MWKISATSGEGGEEVPHPPPLLGWEKCAAVCVGGQQRLEFQTGTSWKCRGTWNRVVGTLKRSSHT